MKLTKRKQYIGELRNAIESTEIVLEKTVQDGVEYKRVLRKCYEKRGRPKWKDGEIDARNCYCRLVINELLSRIDLDKKGKRGQHISKEKIRTFKILEDWRPLCRKCGCVLWRKAPPGLAKWCMPYTKGANYCKPCWDEMHNDKEMPFEEFYDMLKKQAI